MENTSGGPTQAESVATSLLDNAMSGLVPHLRELAHSYPYHPSDLRPVDAVMQFLQTTPLSFHALRFTPTNTTELQPMLRALASLEVIYRSGQVVEGSLECDDPTSVMLSTILEKNWASILSWLTYTLEYSERAMPPKLLSIPILTVAQFLSRFSRPPFSPAIMGDYLETIELALRVWCREFNQGNEDAFINSACSMAELFGNCLDMKGLAGAAVMAIFQNPNQAEAFLKSYAIHITALDTASQSWIETMRLLEMQSWYIHLMKHLSDTTSWSSVWRWSNRNGTIIAFSKSIHTLLRSSTYIERWRLAHVGDLIAMAEKDEEGIISKVVQLLRADLAPILYECLRTMRDCTPSKLVVRGFMRHLSAYLAYPRVSRAVTVSFSHHFNTTPKATPPSDPVWEHFWTTLTLSSISVAVREATYIFQCDNLDHLELHRRNGVTSGNDTKPRRVCSGCKTVFYCSKECQRDDWNALHRLECSSASALLRARRKKRQWFPWGSKENLGAALVHLMTLISLQGADLGPIDAVSILDWRLGAPDKVKTNLCVPPTQCDGFFFV
ncbi:hypothetical protein D9611_013483 [Ephemerocybe angulata]|uniref:MYND-type domain-containing protein n=1 Tax=Ephemerocybe angulata TaxID=980116 RepID=A0A8H5BTH8_9AGAR|nr:hypothetical protein D9611_013500 [Tulosesus angulatus]KAF5328987.1 hypothetical protein D9611_013483 [Tulosesus angulatus]